MRHFVPLDSLQTLSHPMLAVRSFNRHEEGGEARVRHNFVQARMESSMDSCMGRC
jgi:hypothetical protein